MVQNAQLEQELLIADAPSSYLHCLQLFHLCRLDTSLKLAQYAGVYLRFLIGGAQNTVNDSMKLCITKPRVLDFARPMLFAITADYSIVHFLYRARLLHIHDSFCISSLVSAIHQQHE